MPTNLPRRYQPCRGRTEVVSLLTAWVRQLKPFGRRPPVLLAARLASKAIDMANMSNIDPKSTLASETWEFHTRAYLFAMLADFYSVVDAVANTISSKNPTPSELRKVCERAAIRALVDATASDLSVELYRSSLGHACRILDERVHS
jgi:hypothetical protein